MGLIPEYLKMMMMMMVMMMTCYLLLFRGLSLGPFDSEAVF